jgi:hypothetical protein
MEGHCSTGQSPQWAVVPMKEEEESQYSALFFSLIMLPEYECFHFFQWLKI